MWHKAVSALAIASVLSGCAGALHQLPLVDSGKLSLAQTEVQSGAAPERRAVDDQEVTAILHAALDRIRPSATALCRELGVGVCEWKFQQSKDRSMNAGAAPGGVIVVNRGIVEYADNEEQVALVIAHEIGHQAANHLENSRRNATVGAVVGAVLLGVLGAALSYRSPNSGYITQSAMNTGSSLGGAVGRISFSKEQEREADYLAAVILYRSGVDLDKARGFLVKMARASGRRETGMLDTHPAGPERVAAWDRAVEEIKASDGALPKRAN